MTVTMVGNQPSNIRHMALDEHSRGNYYSCFMNITLLSKGKPQKLQQNIPIVFLNTSKSWPSG